MKQHRHRHAMILVLGFSLALVAGCNSEEEEGDACMDQYNQCVNGCSGPGCVTECWNAYLDCSSKSTSSIDLLGPSRPALNHPYDRSEAAR